MLSVSQTTGYAIKALACIATQDKPLLIRDISSAAGVPAPYLAKIVRRLRAAGIVSAKRGHKGGVQMARPPASISLLTIGEAIEGEELVGNCLLGKVFCEDLTACPTYTFWKKTGESIRSELDRLSLADIIAFNRNHARKAGRAQKKRGIK